MTAQQCSAGPSLMTQDLPTESSPLVLTTEDDDNGDAATGQASVWQTVLNLMKTCMGTGCIALAFACQQTGVVVYVTGLLAIAAWNVVCMSRLVKCLDYIPPDHHRLLPQERGREHATTKLYFSDEEEEAEVVVEDPASFPVLAAPKRAEESNEHPPRGTSTLGRVAWYAFGTRGLQALDILFVLLLLGIIVAYVAGVITFVGDTPFTVSRVVDAIMTGFVMGAVSLVPDMGYLSGASAFGLIVLLSAFVVIAGYGLFGVDEDAASGLDAIPTPLKLWPSSLNGVSHWFGIVVFGYGVVPLTYNIRESMQDPEKMVGATTGALALVAASYMLMGVGLYALFPNLTSDVLHELPATRVLPAMTRLAMSWTVLATAPLLIVPCAELLEGKLGFTHRMPLHRAVVRFSVVGVCVVVAVLLPDFVQVLALVGCFCVALVSFCLPPALHLRLAYLVSAEKEAIVRVTLSMADVGVDCLLLGWGIVATIVSTFCILRN